MAFAYEGILIESLEGVRKVVRTLSVRPDSFGGVSRAPCSGYLVGSAICYGLLPQERARQNEWNTALVVGLYPEEFYCSVFAFVLLGGRTGSFFSRLLSTGSMVSAQA